MEIQFYVFFILIISSLLLLDSVLTPRLKIFQYAALVAIIVVAGYRYNVGYDFITYKSMYEDKSTDDSVEPGFLAFMKLIRGVDGSFQDFLLVTAIITYVVTFIAIIKQTENSRVALIIYMLIPGLFLNSLSILRQSLAISFSFLAFYYIVNQKPYKYAFLMLLSVSMHYSAIVVVPFHFLALRYANKASTKNYIWFIVGSIVLGQLKITNSLSFFLNSFDKYSGYTTDFNDVNIYKLLVLNSILILFLLLLDSQVQTKKINYVTFFTVLSIVITNSFSTLQTITRFAYYFRIYEIILVAEIVYIFYRSTRYVIFSGIYIFYSIMFIAALQNDSQSDNIPRLTPYKSVYDEE